jgi:hypothetical protein
MPFLHSPARRSSCYTPLIYDSYTICSVILHVTGIQATSFRWFCGSRYLEGTWCPINVCRTTVGVLTAVLLTSQVLWPVNCVGKLVVLGVSELLLPPSSRDIESKL